MTTHRTSFRRTWAARAGLPLALVLSLLGTGDAFAADEEERRALSLDEVTTEEKYNAEMARLAEEKRLESINRLRALLADAPEGDRKAEMLLRLASLFSEQGKSKFQAEMDAFFKQQDECYQVSETGEDCARMEPALKDSRGWYEKAIKLYQSIIRSYPRYARADEATFYLGMSQQDIREPDQAVDAFKTLVKLYPTSAFVPQSYILIGEYYFERNEAFPALTAYRKAATYKDEPQYAYAMYKLAWCYYNVEEYSKAIDTMKAVVAHSMEAAEGESQAIRLEEEALKDLVRFFADAGEMEEAYDYFTKLGKKNLIRAMLKRLAGLYFEQGKFDQSVETYRRLIMENPQHPENPNYQEDIIEAYRKIGAKDRVLDEIRRLKSDYGRSSAWWRANASDPDAQSEADATIEKALRKTATEFNKEARDLKKAKHPRAQAMFETAIDAYYVYFEDYDDHANAYNVHYDFGELLYDQKRYQEAYDQYMKVVSMDPKGQHSRFCAESAIFAAEEMVKKEGGGEIKMRQEKVTKDQQPIPLTEWEQRLIGACKQYADLYEGDKKVEVATYKSAFLLYSRFHFADAADQFRSVISRWPDSQNAEFSANLILDALNIKEEWVSLRDTAKTFYEQEGLGNSKFKKEMYEIWSSAAFTVIEEDFKKNEDYAKTADDYVAFYGQFPDFEKVDFALNNAAAYYYKADRVADSMKIRHILIDNEQFGPKTKFYYRQIAALGYDYERLADFEQAAFYYDKLFSLYPEEREALDDDKKAEDKEQKLADMDAQAADALYSSAVFRNALGDWEGAIARYRDFLENFPEDDRAVDVQLTIGKIYEDHEDHAAAAEQFASFYDDNPDASPDFTFFARLHEGRALRAMGKEDDARKVFARGVDQYEKLKKAGAEPGAYTEFVAEMLFRLAEPKTEDWKEVRITSKYRAGESPSRSKIKAEDKHMKAALSKKTGGLVELEKTYGEILQTGAGEWGLASIIALGRVYENMGETLTTGPCPFYLTDDQCEIYQMTLEDKAYIQEEKAVEAYKLALDKSYELNLYNDNTAYATRRLGELRPDDYPGLQEIIPQPGLTADKVRSFELETSLD